MREAPSLQVVRGLCERGAKVKAHDPQAGHEAAIDSSRFQRASGALPAPATQARRRPDVGGCDPLVALQPLG